MYRKRHRKASQAYDIACRKGRTLIEQHMNNVHKSMNAQHAEILCAMVINQIMEGCFASTPDIADMIVEASRHLSKEYWWALAKQNEKRKTCAHIRVSGPRL